MVLTSGTLLVLLAAVAQATPARDGARTAWFLSAGTESQSYRDISRTRRPVDASPVEWRGRGPSITGGYEWRGVRRLHRLTLDIASARSFSYVGPVQSAAAPREDRALRVDGRYEYRRYPLDDVLMRGLAAGIGVQGIGRRLSITRTASTSVMQHGSDVTAGIGCVAAARIHRWARWSADVEWVNAIAIAHTHETVDVDPLADANSWGAGWLTDLTARLTIRLSGPTAVNVSYLRTGDGTISSHNSYASTRERLAVGVTYAR